jgi:ring-1,2-phenylacetyl-CoA epoxidase subunit PaaE
MLLCRKMQNYTLKVVKVLKETDDTCTICFKQPALKKIKYLPGQYLTVTANINNRKYKRPYSLSSAPGLDDTLNITVKRLYQGIVSNHLIDLVKEGDLMELMEPIGDFVYKEDIHSSQEIFLWAAGSGITPLMSILKAALKTKNQKIHLYYCNKTLKETIFYDELKALKSQYFDTFSLKLFFTNEQNEDAGYGRIDGDVVKKAISVTELKNTLHFICGPEGLKKNVKAVLAENNTSPDQIFSEDFENIIDQSKIEEIHTQFVEIIKGDKKASVEVIRGKNILDAALDADMDLPYSCQTGSCTLCKAKLISGEVKTINNVKPEKDVADDERLLCCSYPLTDNVIFEINY